MGACALATARLRMAGLSLLATALCHCAATAGPVHTAPRTQPVEAAQAYATRVPAGTPAGDDAITRAVIQLAEPGGLQYDPRLSEVARQAMPPGPLRPPDVGVLDALMRAQGLVEPVPLLEAASGTEAGVEDALRERLQQALQRRTPTHWGLAVRTGEGGAAAVLLLSTRYLQLEPVPRSVAVGDSLHLRGELSAGLHAPGWVVTPPAGDVRRWPAAEGSRHFELELRLETPGEHRVELIAEGPAGVTVVANFPVWCGQPPPEVKPTTRANGSEALDAESVEARLRELIRRERERAGRAALERLPALDAVALAHTRDMATHDFVAHQSPRSGSPSDRVRDAGLHAWLVRENLGRGYSAEEIHEGLMRSPGHRDNLLSSDAESLGLAVLEVPEGSRTAFVATELFASLSRPLDVAHAREQVLEEIARTRAEAGMKRVREDARLAKAAGAAAERYLRGEPSKQAVLEQAMAEAALPTGAERLGASLVVLYGMGQLADQSLALDRGARFVGVGVAQGQRADTPPHALAVVVLYAL